MAKTVRELYDLLIQRRKNCLKTAKDHPDLGSRVAADARAKTYAIVILELEEMLSPEFRTSEEPTTSSHVCAKYLPDNPQVASTWNCRFPDCTKRWTHRGPLGWMPVMVDDL